MATPESTNANTNTNLSQMDLDVTQFEEQAATHLGNANGNIYISKPGLKGVNDGQVYVRLKKKRFVVLDYTIQPNEADMAAANGVAYMEIPSGAGKVFCTNKECRKIGVPVKLYDSHPEDSVSLYLRSGLCFECQRNLNEKRRVDRRKRPQDPTQILYSISSPTQKKFKLNSGEIIELKHDAIIVNGSIKGIKTAAEGHGAADIAVDLQDYLREATYETERLLSTASGSPHHHHHHPPDPMAVNTQALYEKAFTSMNKAIFLMTQWKAAWDAGNIMSNHDPNNGHTMVSLLLAADKDQQRDILSGSSSGVGGDHPEPPSMPPIKKDDDDEDQDHHHHIVQDVPPPPPDDHPPPDHHHHHHQEDVVQDHEVAAVDTPFMEV